MFVSIFINSVLYGGKDNELGIVFIYLVCFAPPDRYIRYTVMKAKYGILDGIHIVVTVYIYLCVIGVTVLHEVVLPNDC